MKLIGSHVQDLAVGEEAQELSKIVDSGVRTAAETFESLIQGLVGTQQEPFPHLVTAKNKESDAISIDDALSGLRNFVVGIASGLDLLGKPASSRSESTVESQTNNKTSCRAPTAESSTSSTPRASENAPGRMTSTATCQSSSPSFVDAKFEQSIATPMADISAQCQEAKPIVSSDKGKSKLMSKKLQHLDQGAGTTSEHRYHGPGPIYLPSYATLRRPASFADAGALPTRPGCVDQSWRHQSIDSAQAFEDGQATSPPPAATRFPSLAQFETQHTKRVPSFPALPSMEPLVPQQATSHLIQDPSMRNESKLQNVSSHETEASRQQPPATQRDSMALCDNYQTTYGIIQPRQDQEEQSATVKPQGIHPNRRIKQHDQNGYSNPREEQVEGSMRDVSYERSRGYLRDQSIRNNPHHQDSWNSLNPWESSPIHQEEPPSQIGHSPAARLAEPFDPLDVEPTARPYLNDGIRRNATVAGTDSRFNARRRRPYSEAFDGTGRIAWDSFLPDSNLANRSPPRHPLVTRRQEHLRRGRDIRQKRQEQMRKSATHFESTQRLSSPFRRYDDEHHDSTTASQITACVDNLVQLGYDTGEAGSLDRLRVYAQAADGDLTEAIDLIDEEQRAYRQGF